MDSLDSQVVGEDSLVVVDMEGTRGIADFALMGSPIVVEGTALAALGMEDYCNLRSHPF